MQRLLALLRRMLGIKSAGEHAQMAVHQRVTLEKFDGEMPAVGELKEPIEVWESQDDAPMQVIYRKGEGDELWLYTNDGTGYAVLDEVVKR